MFDGEGRLLLKKGTVIAKQSQLDALISRGLYRDKSGAVNTSMQSKTQAEAIIDHTSPFEMLAEMKHHFPRLLEKIINKAPGIEKSVFSFCKKIQSLCSQDEDAMIGAVHLMHTLDYTCFHPVHVSILANIVGERLGMSAEDRLPVLAAGLTANISMLELQQQLCKHEGALTEEQKKVIAEHPANSVRMLVTAGVYNPVWLKVIMQHHERADGNGYPEGVSGEEISREAQLVSIADRYAAMISSREYREAKSSCEALKGFFEKKCSQCDEILTLTFIKEMGIWPPGTAVKLANGEVALVIKRNEKSMWPIVSSIIGPQGKPYASSLRRDCNDEAYRIKGIFKLNKSMPLNLSRIWGYGKQD